MTGLKQRILGRSASPPATEDPSPTDLPAAQADAAAPLTAPGDAGPQAPAGLTPDDVPTIAHTAAPAPVAAPAAEAAPEEPPAQPAGTDPAEPGRPGFRERGRMRRRLRYLRRAHELGLRDLGGLVFDLRRFRRQRFDLVEAKLQTLSAVDREMRTIEAALNERRAVTELREAGISSCARCGALTSSDANFCANCGLQIGDAPPVVTAPAPPTAPAVASAPSAPVAPVGAQPPVSASDVGSAPLSAAPANGAPNDPAITPGEPLTPPPANR